MITDDTETVPTRHWEINTGFTIKRWFDGRMFGAPVLDINYGLGEHVQVKVELPWLSLYSNGQPTVKGFGKTNVGLRWRFRGGKEHRRVAFSVYPQIEFSNRTAARRGLVDIGSELLLPIEWQKQFGKFSILGEVGYRIKRGEDEFVYGVLVGREFKSFELLGEIHSEGPRTHLSDSEVVYNIGSRVKIIKHMRFLLSAGRSIRRNQDPRFIAYAGIQLTF